MQTGHDVLEVIFDGTWRIVEEDNEFGPFSTEAEAVETARSWAEHAEKQGLHPTVAIPGQPSYEVFGQ